MSGSDPAWSDIRPIRYYAKSSLAAGSDAGSEHDLIAFFGFSGLSSCVFSWTGLIIKAGTHNTDPGHSVTRYVRLTM